jgi:hypothetical protein
LLTAQFPRFERRALFKVGMVEIGGAEPRPYFVDHPAPLWRGRLCILPLSHFHRHAGFQPPWTTEETDACFIVRDHNGQALAYAYFEGSRV